MMPMHTAAAIVGRQGNFTVFHTFTVGVDMHIKQPSHSLFSFFSSLSHPSRGGSHC